MGMIVYKVIEAAERAHAGVEATCFYALSVLGCYTKTLKNKLNLVTIKGYR